MNNRELEQLLKSAPTPQWPEEYRSQFPRRVMAKIHWRGTANPEAVGTRSTASQTPYKTGTRWNASLPRLATLGFGLAAVCIILGFVLGSWHGRRGLTDAQELAQARRCYREIAGLFPNQLQGIVFDQQGAKLVLADKPDVPPSPPLYVKICGPAGCNSFVTFSGQQIRVNGDVFEVLVDHRGDVLVVGRNSAWSSEHSAANTGRYRITAKPLEVAS
jgi:hypothetical protein